MGNNFSTRKEVNTHPDKDLIDKTRRPDNRKELAKV